MSTATNEVLETIARRYNATNPVEPLDKKSQMEVAGVQGATVGALDPALPSATGAGVDVDGALTRARDRLAPAVRLPLGSIALAAGVAQVIPLPRWARQVLVQNNTDITGAAVANVNLTISLDGTPALPGDWTIRPGQTYADDVYVPSLSLYCASALTINSGLVGSIVVEVST